MPREKNKKTHNIFCIDVEKAKSALFEGNDCTMDDIVDALVSRAENFIPQTLRNGINTAGFNVKLIFYGEEKYNSKIKSFCQPFVQENEAVVTFRPKTASTVLFIWSANHIFAVTTGQGFRAVEAYCVPKFGMQVVGVFENAFRITALDSNAMSSIVHSTRTIYSNEVDFIDVDNLDTIFKEVTGRLADKSRVHTLLRLDTNSKKKSMKIVAKNFVQFSSTLDFDGLLHILNILDQYDMAQLTDRFNLVSPITTKQNEAIITANNQAIIEMVYNAVQNDTYLELDLFHRNTNDFVSADSYKFAFNGGSLEIDDLVLPPCVQEAYQEFLHGAADTAEAFQMFFMGTKVEAYKDDALITSDHLLKHFSGEIRVGEKSYYMFYGDYYSLSESYSERLNTSLRGKLRPEYFAGELATVWGANDKEDDYNRNASAGEGYVHLHKVKPELIEFADLLKIENDIATIIHVKDGFDGSMRELERQVELSIARMIDLQNNNQEAYIKKLYQNALTNTVAINIATQFPSEQDFIDKMKQCTYRYVIALRVENRDLLASRSNIAKHCLNSLILKCFNRGVELKINLV